MRAHAWVEGALINGAKLATCEGCETLRVTEGIEVTFIVRARDEADRVLASEPLCVSRPRFVPPP